MSLVALLGTGLAVSSSYAQTTNLYSTVGGTIWNDNLPSDGIRQSGEAGVAGILVSLYNASNDSLISAAVSGPDGAYVLQNYKGTGLYYIRFDLPYDGYSIVQERAGSDNLINSSADANSAQTADFNINSTAALTSYGLGLQAVNNTVTHCQSKLMEQTNWAHSFVLPKAPVTLGTLTGVTVFASDAVRHPMIGIENTGGLVTEASLEFSGRLTITLPAPGAALVTNTAFAVAESLSAYDGNTDYAGTSGSSWFNYFSAAFNERNISANNQLSQYTGTGNLTLPAQAQSFTGILGGGNLENVVQTHVAGGVCVVYKFAGGILPVSLSSFSAKKDKQQAEVNWETVAELYNKGFYIERSADGMHFEQLGFVASKAHDGKSTNKLTYSFTDNNPLYGKNIYRLQQVDVDGKVSYSKQAVVFFDAGNSALSLYPNPASQTVSVIAASTEKVTIYDIMGKNINVPINKQVGTQMLDVRSLPNGQYIIHITSNTETKVNKLTIKH